MTAVVSLRNVAKSHLRGKQQVEVLPGVLHLDKGRLVDEAGRRAA